MHDVIVIGGGIAGLATAWELVQRGRRPLVLEAQDRPGGLIRTDSIDGFVIDAGPDSLLVQKPAALTLCRELGLGGRLFPTLAPRTAFILRCGKLIPIPEASVLGIPTRLSPFATTGLFSWRGKARMGMDLLIPARRDAADESIASFIGRRFGREAVDYLADPLLAGIHAGDVSRLSVHASFPRLVEAELRHGSVLRGLMTIRTAATRSSADGAFMSLPGGTEELVRTLVARLPPDTVRTGAGVSSIEGRAPFRLTVTSGDTVEARALVVAAPAWAAAPLLQNIDPVISTLAAEVRYASSATVALAFRREQVRHSLDGSGFLVPRAERRALLAGTWVSSKWPHRAPAGTVLLRGFVGGMCDEAILQRADDEIVGAVLDEFAALLGITGMPLLARMYRWMHASAQHEVGHIERMKEIDRRLTDLPGLYVTGSGFRGTGIPDCVSDGRSTGAAAAAFLG